MQWLLSAIGLLIMLLHLSPADARPPTGFHEGPYLIIEVGAVQSDFDTDQQNGEKVGFDVEPGYGFLFGWNLWDDISTELRAQYATNINGGRREHLVNVNVSTRYSFIFDHLTDFQSLRILPFLKAGPGFRFYILPGNRLASDTVVTSYGIGPSAGGGIAFLWKKYLYFGIDAQGDFLYFTDVHQNLDLATPTLAEQLIYRGGFQPTYSVSAMLGVHY